MLSKKIETDPLLGVLIEDTQTEVKISDEELSEELRKPSLEERIAKFIENLLTF